MYVNDNINIPLLFHIQHIINMIMWLDDADFVLYQIISFSFSEISSRKRLNNLWKLVHFPSKKAKHEKR